MSTVSKERPILFATPMVRAILDGSKTQTRRIVNLDRLRVRLPNAVGPDSIPGYTPDCPVVKRGTHCATMNQYGAVSVDTGDRAFLGVRPGEFHFECPFVDGNTSLVDHGNGRQVWTITPREPSRLWVRETFAVLTGNGIRPVYRADGEAPVPNMRWTPSIHMEHRWSRISLEITSVRVERLQEITDADAAAEGARRFDNIPDLNPYGQGPRWSMESPTNTDQCLRTARFAFASLWNSISDETADWDANPWVWVVSFRRVEEAKVRRAG